MKPSLVLPAVILLFLLIVAGVFWQSSEILEKLFKIDSEKVSKSVVALSAIGLLTMAMIQAARNLFPIRGWCHESMISARFGKAAIQQLHARLQISNSPLAFYDLPIQSVCGQIAAVAESVLTEEIHPKADVKGFMPSALLIALAGDSATKDLVARAQSLQSSNELRAQVGARIQRNIDNLQITVGSRWRLYLRIAATALSVVFSEALLFASNDSWRTALALTGAAIVGGMIAGYLASIFRDTVAVVERWRQS